MYKRQPLGLPTSAVHLPDSTAADGTVAARRYGEQLSGCGGIGLQLLGLGSNGHVGFNEPPCPPDQHCHEVELTSATRQQNAVLFDGCVEAVPQRAITLGLWEILEAAEIHLVVTGSVKSNNRLRMPALALVQQLAQQKAASAWMATRASESENAKLEMLVRMIRQQPDGEEEKATETP